MEESAGGGEHDLMVIILHRDSIMSSIGITLAGGADYETKEITVSFFQKYIVLALLMSANGVRYLSMLHLYVYSVLMITN